MKSDRPTSRVKVWDGGVRLFHWSIVALIPMLWFSAEEGYMDWHRRFGLTMLGLVVFRLYWGFAGTRTARFVDFVKGPKAIVAYLGKLKRPYLPRIGHNALGALAVIALLTALAAQVTAGLFAVDVDGIESGPLSHLVSFDQGRDAAEFHETMFNVILALIGLHLAAIAFYALALKADLIRPMATGARTAPPAPGEQANDAAFPVVRFVIGVALAAAVVYLVQA